MCWPATSWLARQVLQDEASDLLAGRLARTHPPLVILGEAQVGAVGETRTEEPGRGDRGALTQDRATESSGSLLHH